MENNQVLSFSEVKLYILDHYAKEPSAEKLQDVLNLCTPLSPVECAEIVQVLCGFKNLHGMSKSALEKAIVALRTTDENVYFEGGILKPIRVVEDLLANNYLTAYEDEQLRIYEGGVYREDRTRRTARYIHELLGDDVTPAHVSSVISLLKDVTMTVMPRHTNWVNLANGRWCLESWQLLEHDPIYQSVIQLPVLYDKDAKCPVFNAWLKNVLPAQDDQFLLLQLMGYSMLQDVRFGKIAVLYGPTHTGKSTCLEVIQAFLGKENVSALTLHALDNEERRFTRAGLVGKLANLSADLSSRYLSGDSQIKQIASGDPMQVEYKGVQSFTYAPFATLWASSNELPVSHDRTDAWYERLMILPFMQQHKGEEAKRDMVKRLTQSSELSGILNLVLDALKELLKDNAFKETESTQNMLEMYKEQNDHVARFLGEWYEFADKSEVPEDDLYSHYKEWCDHEGNKVLPKTKFRDSVEKWGPKRKRPIRNGKRYFAFEGMRSL